MNINNFLFLKEAIIMQTGMPIKNLIKYIDKLVHSKNFNSFITRMKEETNYDIVDDINNIPKDVMNEYLKKQKNLIDRKISRALRVYSGYLWLIGFSKDTNTIVDIRLLMYDHDHNMVVDESIYISYGTLTEVE